MASSMDEDVPDGEGDMIEDVLDIGRTEGEISVVLAYISLTYTLLYGCSVHASIVRGQSRDHRWPLR